MPAAAEDTAEKLATYLKDPSYKVRLKAAITIGKLKVTDAAPALRGALSDDDDTVRAAAAYSLGQLGDQASRGALVTQLSDAKPLIFKATTKALWLLDRAKGPAARYLVVVEEPAMARGIAASRGKRMARSLKRKLERSPIVIFSAGEQNVLQGARLASHLKGRKLTGMGLRPKIVKLDTRASGGGTSFECKVSVMVVALVKNRMEFAAAGEANAEVEETGLDPDTMDDVIAQILDASAEAAADEVAGFLARRQGP